MSVIAVGLFALASLIVLLFLGVPVGIALGIIGVIGNTALSGFTATLSQLGLITWEQGTSFVLIAIPLFIYMGQLVYHTGMATDLYDCMHKWFGRMPGGLAITATMTSAAFGAVTGSSLVTVATMGAMAMPELRRFNYDLRLATGSIAAAACIAILIPPSIPMVIYGVWTETSIGALFMAGIIPGIITTVFFCMYILVLTSLRPHLGPRGPAYSWGDRFAATIKLLPTAIIFIIVLGGIYGGVFTPTEASAVGAAGVTAIALASGRLSIKALRESLGETVSVSAMIFTIMIGGILFARFMVTTDVTPSLVALVGSLDVSPYVIILLLLVLYLVLGCMLDTLAMLILTLPFVIPLIVQLGFDKVWFGIFVTMMIELALITPPVGLNVYVMKRVAPDVPIGEIFLGTLPFVFLVLITVGLLIAFPQIALWLPNTMIK